MNKKKIGRDLKIGIHLLDECNHVSLRAVKVMTALARHWNNFPSDVLERKEILFEYPKDRNKNLLRIIIITLPCTASGVSAKLWPSERVRLR